jgi:hypothetical protein
MGVMKRSLLVLAIIFAFGIPANAAITTEQMTDPDYIINNGYSEATAEEILISKNRNAGKPVEPLYGKKHNKFVNFWRNLYGYIDPSVDTDERYHHDIHPGPSWHDL